MAEDLLIELASEEIPARMQVPATEQLAGQVRTWLEEQGLTGFGEIVPSVTPRRLAVIVRDLPETIPGWSEERRGPRPDAPEKAVQGFLKSNGARPDQLQKREIRGNTYWVLAVDHPPVPVIDRIPDLVHHLVQAFPWPKSMRWGHGTVSWIRPLRGLICLYGDRLVDVTLDPGGGTHIQATGSSEGHRFLSPGPVPIPSAGLYAQTLREHRVIVDHAERCERIASALARAASGLELHADPNAALIAEQAGLVETPIVLIGKFDPAFLALPEEILDVSMATHQRALGLKDLQGERAPCFYFVANTEGPEDNRKIIAGNERVIRARLADAQFFLEQDRKQTLESRLALLEHKLFHNRIGSMRERAERIASLARRIAQAIGADQPELAFRAGLLAKTDLESRVVQEFPELQGIMGGYYAHDDGEPEAVAEAIRLQYRPAGSHDPVLPQGKIAVAVGLASRLDALAGLFAAGEKPGGSKDPFALRREAQSVIQIILHHRLHLSLGELVLWALEALPASLQGKTGPAEIVGFIGERLRVLQRTEGRREDHIRAIFGYRGEDDLVRMMARLDALARFLDTEAGGELLSAFRRAANLLRIEEKQEHAPQGASRPALAVDQAQLQAPEEIRLVDHIRQASLRITDQMQQGLYQEALLCLAQLREPVDAFFDNVRVNAEEAELRANRLAILAEIRDLMALVADFSQIAGSGN